MVSFHFHFYFHFLFRILYFVFCQANQAIIQLFNYSIGYSVRYSMPKLEAFIPFPDNFLQLFCSILLLTFIRDLQWKCVTLNADATKIARVAHVVQSKDSCSISRSKHLPQKNSGFRFFLSFFLVFCFVFKVRKIRVFFVVFLVVN